MENDYENYQATDKHLALYANPLAFRQERCARYVLRISLPFAKAAGRYTVTDEDSCEKTVADDITALCFDAPRTAKLLGGRKI